MTAIPVIWHNTAQTIIRYHFPKAWSWDDIYSAIDKAVVLLDSVQHRVCLVLDLTESERVPNLNVIGLQRIANAPTAKHPNAGIFVMVGMRPVVRAIADVFFRLYPAAGKQYRTAATLEEAITLINEYMELHETN